MIKLTVICYEEGYESNILIYDVEVHDPQDQEEVTAAVQEARNNDLEGDDAGSMHVLFAFAGDLPVLADWRT